MNIYELHGRLAEQHSEEQRNHLLSLELIGKLSRGMVDPSRVTMTENGWKLAPVVPHTVKDTIAALRDPSMRGEPEDS